MMSKINTMSLVAAPAEVKRWSDKAETVWQELLRWKQRPPKKENIESENYYNSVYQQNFGTPLPESVLSDLREVSEEELQLEITSALNNIKKENCSDDECNDIYSHDNPSTEANVGMQPVLPECRPFEMPNTVQQSQRTCSYSSSMLRGNQIEQECENTEIMQTEETVSDLFAHHKLQSLKLKKLPEDRSVENSLAQEENNRSQPLFSQLTENVSWSREEPLTTVYKDTKAAGVLSSPPLDLSPDQESFTILSQMYSNRSCLDTVEKNQNRIDILQDPGGTFSIAENQPETDRWLDSDSYNTIPDEAIKAETLHKNDNCKIHEMTPETQIKMNVMEKNRENYDRSNGNFVKEPQQQQQRASVVVDKENLAVTARQQYFTIEGRLKTLSTLRKQSDNTEKRKVPAKLADRKPTFAAPFKRSLGPSLTQENFKKTVSSETLSREAKQWELRHVADMSEVERTELRGSLGQAEEVALTLRYQDSSSQLREDVKQVEKKKTHLGSLPVSVVVAYPDETNKSNCKLSFVLFPLTIESAELQEFCCVTIGELMESRCRKLAFEAQEIVKSLITNMKFTEKKVCTEWHIFDVKVAGWLLNPDNPPVTFKHVLMPCQELQQECFSDSEEFVCADLSLLGPVMSHYYQRLRQQHLWKLFTDIETPLVSILAVMETRSIQINTSEMSKTCNLLKKRLRKLEQEAHTLAGQPFNINSHPQLRQILFEVLHLDTHLPKSSRSKTTHCGKQSTSEAVLSQLADIHPLPRVVLEYRQLQKLKSTYIDGMVMYVLDNQLHTHWDQVAAATGRLTSTNPNIQAIPKLPVEVQAGSSCIVGKEIASTQIFARSPFMCREGWSFLAADFRQIELRILAHLSKDETLLRIFNSQSGGDIFIELASSWLCKNAADVSNSDREQVKRVVYSVMYGAGKDRLAEYLKIGTDDAKAIVQSFLVKFPGVSTFTRSCISAAKVQRYQTTVFKRRRFLPKITDSKQQLQAQAERQAINFSVQGSAADLCKSAMIQVERSLQCNPHLHGKLLFQIHDELLLEIPDEEITQTAELVKGIMEDKESLCGSMCSLTVPLQVSMSVGKSWGHLKDYLTNTGHV